MLKGILNKVLVAVSLTWICAACGGAGVEVSTNSQTAIYPDYMGVTIPFNIAPLNFHYTSKGIRKAQTTVRYDGTVVQFSGKNIVWDLDQWKDLISSAEDDAVLF